MDSDTSTVAETLDLDNTNNNGLCFYKTLEYTHRNKKYNINIYSVVDYNMFVNNALFNGWLLTSDRKYSSYYKEVPPFTWDLLDSIIINMV